MTQSLTQCLASTPHHPQHPALDGGEDVARLACGRLTLSHFRNYEHARIEPGSNPVVLTGSNGAGKTNVLEALSFLVPGTGLRRARLNQVARLVPNDDASPHHPHHPQHPHHPWAVAATIHGGAFDVDLGTGLETTAASKRVLHVDGQPARGLSTLNEHFAVHWLTPQMDRLFLDGAQERRRFLDRIVFSFDGAHAGRMTAYSHALRERATLLSENKMDDAWLSALEDTMATRGASVAAARLDVAQRLVAAADCTDSVFPAAQLAIDGLAEQWLTQCPAVEVEDRLRAALRQSRTRDARANSTSAADGRLPHQSDLLVTHTKKSMPAGQCSTGEQKMLLVGLVLAAARMSAADEARVPVLLLDEVAAHLDTEHLDALFGEVLALGSQAWFTGTDANLFTALNGSAKFYQVDAARIHETDGKHTI